MYYTKNELESLNLKYFGSNVLIDKTVLIHNPNDVEIGDNSRIDAYVVISGKFVIGNNVHIAVGCIFNGGKLGIKIGNFSGFAYGCCAFTSSDDYSGEYLTGPTIPPEYKSIIEKSVVIKNHVIVGTRSIVFPGVTLAEGTSIGAMSLVVKNTSPWKIYFGVPAVIISDRKKKVLELETNYLKKYFKY